MNIDEAFLNYIRLRIQDIATKPLPQRNNYWISLIQEIAFTSIPVSTRNQAANEVRLVSNIIKDIDEIDPDCYLLTEVSLFSDKYYKNTWFATTHSENTSRTKSYLFPFILSTKDPSFGHLFKPESVYQRYQIHWNTNPLQQFRKQSCLSKIAVKTSQIVNSQQTPSFSN